MQSLLLENPGVGEKIEQKRISSLKQTTKEKKTKPFFSKRGRVQYKIKYRRDVHCMKFVYVYHWIQVKINKVCKKKNIILKLGITL